MTIPYGECALVFFAALVQFGLATAEIRAIALGEAARAAMIAAASATAKFALISIIVRAEGNWILAGPFVAADLIATYYVTKFYVGGKRGDPRPR